MAASGRARDGTGRAAMLRRVTAAMALIAALAFAMSLPTTAAPPDTFKVPLARQEVSPSFTAIQRQAFGALRAMGFRPSEARALVRLIERGGAEGASARSIAGARSRGERVDPRVLGRLEAHGGRQLGGRTARAVGLLPARARAAACVKSSASSVFRRR